MSDMDNEKPFMIVRGPRKSGVTTALLDIAFANARRGQTVHYWCTGPALCQDTYRFACKLLNDPDVEVVDVPGRHEIKFGAGSLRFRYSGDNHKDGRGITNISIEDSEHGDSLIERYQ